MTFSRRIAAAALSLAFVLPVAALAQTVTLDKGETLTAQVQNTLDTGKAYAGERFTARVVPPYPRGDTDLANAVVNGEVTKVVAAGQGRKPELYLSFNSITLQNGTSYPLNAQMTDAAQKKQTRNGGHVALTTLGGLIAGNIIGKTIFHTNAGGLLGAAGGFLVGYNKKSNIVLKSGSNVTLTLTRPLLVRRQAGRPY